MALKRQARTQTPQSVQADKSITAFSPPENNPFSTNRGLSTKGRPAASTSQSATAISCPSTAKQAVSEVLPVPPLPEITTTSLTRVERPLPAPPGAARQGVGSAAPDAVPTGEEGRTGFGRGTRLCPARA